MKTLSVMIDEAGNFDMQFASNPIYCLTLVFHDQNDCIDDQIDYFEKGLVSLGQDPRKAVHTSPLIRREPPYQNMGREEMSKLMALTTIFVKKLPIKYKAFIFNKRESDSYNAFLGKMNSEGRMFIQDNLAFFQAYDNIIIYYDRGQKEISDLLKATFEEIFKPNVEMRLAFQYEYKLLQVADYICTMEYSKEKWDTGRATNSEITFFGSRRLFIKRYYAGLRKLKF